MQKCIFNVARMLQNLVSLLSSVWQMFAGFCFVTLTLSATPTPA